MSETLPPPIRTGGDSPRGPEKYGYPLRMAAGFVQPRGEIESLRVKPVSIRRDDIEPRRTGPRLEWWLGAIVALLVVFWLLTACEQIQTVAASDMRPFPTPFIN